MLNLPEDEIERIKEMKPSLRELRHIDLKRDYKALRKAYFGTSIPEADSVAIVLAPIESLKKCGKERLMGYTSIEVGYPIDLIVINETLNESTTRLTLLHEMAHIKVNRKFGRDMGHGKNWNKEMVRLAVSGAFDRWW